MRDRQSSPGNVSGLSRVERLLTDHTGQAGLSGNQNCARCKVRSMHDRQGSPGNVSGLSWVKLLLTDCTESSHKHQHRLSIQAATTGVHLVDGTCPWSHRPCCLHKTTQETVKSMCTLPCTHLLSSVAMYLWPRHLAWTVCIAKDC